MRNKLKENILPLALLFIIIITFVIFQPRISSILPQKRSHDLNKFIKNSLQHNEIDSASYWEFREFYYPGVFSLNRDGFNINSLDPNLSKLLPRNTTNYVFLRYQSKYSKSIDVLTKDNDLTTFFSGSAILRNKNSLIFKQGESIVIVVLRNNVEMQKVNGFLKYQDKDKELIKGRNWLSIMIIAP